MSIEKTFESIAQSLSRIADTLEKTPTTVASAAPVVQPVAQAPVAAPVFVAPTPAPVAVVAPVAAPVAAPMFAAPAPAPVPAAPSENPFGKDEQGTDYTLTTYAMAAYRSLGPIKGAGIQGVLAKLGHTALNEVKPEQYAQFRYEVEQLKVTA